MNRFFRSALFPLIIIAALVWLALQTLGGGGQKATPWTTSQAYQQVRNNPRAIDKVTSQRRPRRKAQATTKMVAET